MQPYLKALSVKKLYKTIQTLDVCKSSLRNQGLFSVKTGTNTRNYPKHITRKCDVALQFLDVILLHKKVPCSICIKAWKEVDSDLGSIGSSFDFL